MLRCVSALPDKALCRAASEAANNQVRLCVAKNKNGDWKSGFFTVEANVLFVLNLLELFLHWRSKKDDFRGCVMPEAGRSVLFFCTMCRKLDCVLCGQVLLYSDPSLDISAWVSQTLLQVTFVSEAASFSAVQAVPPSTNGHLYVDLRQQACPDGSGAGVFVQLSGNTFPLQSLFSDWRSDGAGATYVRFSRVYKDPREITDLAERLVPLQSLKVKCITGFEQYPALEAALCGKPPTEG